MDEKRQIRAAYQKMHDYIEACEVELDQIGSLVIQLWTEIPKVKFDDPEWARIMWDEAWLLEEDVAWARSKNRKAFSWWEVRTVTKTMQRIKSIMAEKIADQADQLEKESK